MDLSWSHGPFTPGLRGPGSLKASALVRLVQGGSTTRFICTAMSISALGSLSPRCDPEDPRFPGFSGILSLFFRKFLVLKVHLLPSSARPHTRTTPQTRDVRRWLCPPGPASHAGTEHTSSRGHRDVGLAHTRTLRVIMINPRSSPNHFGVFAAALDVGVPWE